MIQNQSTLNNPKPVNIEQTTSIKLQDPKSANIEDDDSLSGFLSQNRNKFCEKCSDFSGSIKSHLSSTRESILNAKQDPSTSKMPEHSNGFDSNESIKQSSHFNGVQALWLTRIKNKINPTFFHEQLFSESELKKNEILTKKNQVIECIKSIDTELVQKKNNDFKKVSKNIQSYNKLKSILTAKRIKEIENDKIKETLAIDVDHQKLQNYYVERLKTEVPLPLQISIKEEATMIVSLTEQMYKSILGSKHKLTIEAASHLRMLKGQIYDK